MNSSSSSLNPPEPASNRNAPPTGDQPKPSWIIPVLLILTVNLAVFLPSMRGDFLWDDKMLISENPNILGSQFLKNLLTSPFGGFSGLDENSRALDRVMQFYRPLVSVSFWLDFKVWGLNPAGFHLTNILLQTVNALLFFAILSGLRLSPVTSFAGALLFSVFPLHFENVAWISGRTDLLSFLFGALSILLFLKFLKSGRRAGLIGSALFYFLSLLSKENAVLLPLIYLLFLYKKEKKPRDLVILLSPFAFSLLAWFTLRSVAFGSVPSASSGRNLLDLLAAVGFYSWKILWPFRLSVTVNALDVFRNPVYQLLGGGLVIALAVSVFLALRKNLETGWPLTAFLSYFLLLLPAVAVIFSPLTLSFLAWRFLYFPSAVFIGAAAYALTSRSKLFRPALALGALLILGCVAELYPKARLFGRQEAEFWLGIKNVEHEDVIARFNIAIKTFPKDEKRALELFDRILSEKQYPQYEYWRIRAYEEMAAYYSYQKNFPKAEYYFNELFKLQNIQSLHGSFSYAYFLGFSGRKDEGEKIVLNALRLFPQSHYVLTGAARFYIIVEDYAKAREFLTEDFRLFRTRQSQRLAERLLEAERKPD